MVKNLKNYFKKPKIKIRNFLKKSRSTSCTDGIIDGVIFGWFISEKSFTYLDIYINGIHIDRVNNFIYAPDIHPNAYRFFYDLKKTSIIKEGDEVELRVDGQRLKGTPLILSNYILYGMIDGFMAYECFGWVGCFSGEIPQFLVMIDNGEVFEPEVTWYIRDDFKRYGISVPTGFKFKLPEKYLDGNLYKISLFNPLTKKKFSKEKFFRFKIKNFWIDIANPDIIAGWIQIGDYPGPVDLDIYIENEKVNVIKANFIREDANKIYGEGCYGFYFSIPDFFKNKFQLYLKERFSFKLYLSNTKIKVIDSCECISQVDIQVDIIEKLEEIAMISREKGEKEICYYLKDSINFIRQNFKHHKYLVNLAKNIEEKVDIIVPVYRGKRETLQCIESILNAKTNIKFELIVINDCSPDPQLRKELIKLKENGKIILIENEENLGFVKSVNIGMKLHPNRDVVILNSDTLVPDYWLDRLRAAAYSSSNIATVTPVSNKATILSFPNFNEDNDLPYDLDYKKIDEICQKVNKGVYIDIPTAIGFCMYIKRECINEIGYFDEEKFDKGYGEENDFCLRASALGWRHIACLDLFVQHHGSLSFGSEKPKRVMKALDVINQLYPDYTRRINKFISKDPIAPYRNKVIKEIIKTRYDKFVIYVIHTWGGGSFKYCKDLAKALEQEKIGSLFLYTKHNKVFFSLYNPNDEFEKWIRLEAPFYWQIQSILEITRDLPIIFIHFNQTMNFKTLEIWKIPELLNVPYFITIHDYFYLCPKINLINAMEIFCDLPQLEVCDQCLQTSNLEKDIEMLFKGFFDASLIKWRNFYENCLKNAKKVIFPSEIAVKYYKKIFNISNFSLLPHLEKIEAKIRPYNKQDIFKIAVLGAIGEHKGYNKLSKLIEFSYKKNLPFEFIIIGYTMDDSNLRKFDNVKITGPYTQEHLSNFIKAYKPHIALFLHIWPETYSYTLSEALQNGLYPVSIDLGAIAERLKKLNYGTLIPCSVSIEEIAQILLNLYENGWNEKEIRIYHVYNNILKDYYEIR